MLNKKIAVVGRGVMAEAVIAGLLHQKFADTTNSTASGLDMAAVLSALGYSVVET